jgi:hypothetical protein
MLPAKIVCLAAKGGTQYDIWRKNTKAKKGSRSISGGTCLSVRSIKTGNQQISLDYLLNRDRNIDSIKIRLLDDLIRFLQNSGGTPPDGAPSVFMFREFGTKSLELELVI